MFGSEIRALRHAVQNGYEAVPVPYGEDAATYTPPAKPNVRPIAVRNGADDDE